jgi:hypothetical protein
VDVFPEGVTLYDMEAPNIQTGSHPVFEAGSGPAKLWPKERLAGFDDLVSKLFNFFFVI